MSLKILGIDSDKRTPTRQGPKKLSGVNKSVNKIGKGIKPPKGVDPNNSLKKKK